MATKKEKKFSVSVTRISYSTREIEVSATNRNEAKNKALDVAGSYEFTEHDAEYKTYGASEITDEFIHTEQQFNTPEQD